MQLPPAIDQIPTKGKIHFLHVTTYYQEAYEHDRITYILRWFLQTIHPVIFQSKFCTQYLTQRF